MIETSDYMRVLFIHQGRSDFLHYAVAQAAHAGLHPIVLGDEEAAVKGYEFHDIGSYQVSAQAFAKVYTHVSRNPYAYELFCYQRWFAARDFVVKFPGSIIVADHDVLVYKHIEKAIHLLQLFNSNRALDCAWFNYIPNRGLLDLICEYFTNVYMDPALLKSKAIQNAIGGSPHLSDMHLLVEMGREHPFAVASVAYHGDRFGFDNNFRLSGNFKTMHGHKAVTWKDGVPFVQTVEGDYTEFYFFHLQGPSKYLMQYMNTIDNEEITCNLPDCERYVRALPDDTSGNDVRNYYDHLKSLAE